MSRWQHWQYWLVWGLTISMLSGPVIAFFVMRALWRVDRKVDGVDQKQSRLEKLIRMLVGQHGHDRRGGDSDAG